VTNKNNGDLTDSDRAKLDELLDDHEFEVRLRAHQQAERAARREAIKFGVSVASAVALGVTVLKDGLLWLWSVLK
jgi:hypothetical protein